MATMDGLFALAGADDRGIYLTPPLNTLSEGPFAHPTSTTQNRSIRTPLWSQICGATSSSPPPVLAQPDSGTSSQVRTLLLKVSPFIPDVKLHLTQAPSLVGLTIAQVGHSVMNAFHEHGLMDFFSFRTRPKCRF